MPMASSGMKDMLGGPSLVPDRGANNVHRPIVLHAGLHGVAVVAFVDDALEKVAKEVMDGFGALMDGAREPALSVQVGAGLRSVDGSQSTNGASRGVAGGGLVVLGLRQEALLSAALQLPRRGVCTTLTSAVASREAEAGGSSWPFLPPLVLPPFGFFAGQLRVYVSRTSNR